VPVRINILKISLCWQKPFVLLIQLYMRSPIAFSFFVFWQCHVVNSFIKCSSVFMGFCIFILSCAYCTSALMANKRIYIIIEATQRDGNDQADNVPF